MPSFQLFRPILAGATLKDRALACIAAAIGIGVSALLVGILAPDSAHHFLWIVPPMGASAVLLFAVPASPMAQPWPAIGGNVISALVGVIIAHLMPQSFLAAGLAVGLAIGAMSLLRCLHPPGGAAALVGLFAGASTSFLFPLLPVGLNAVVLVACAYAYHRLCGRAYPHVPSPAKPAAPAATAPWTFRPGDIAATLEEAGLALDVAPGDLEELLRQVERRALVRAYHELRCTDLMTSGVLSVTRETLPGTARDLLVERDIRRLAVVDEDGRLIGAIGLRELVQPADRIGAIMSPAAEATPDTPAIELLPRFAQDRIHAVFITDAEGRPVGVVTEADWLNVLTRGMK
ncbi:HPP family protein [Ancylobacter sp. 6x-1]|uniref:HPP family protein n=1 Tax=Ancylobacter crimeensis TaxID=2579147 RepID=A0ABT0DFP2_9HYPH|nr:HPP family protein [Ancylobacter crimeensis]MCK0198778.1 HPP family protein [Ancylobacter crimeensis]